MIGYSQAQIPRVGRRSVPRIDTPRALGHANRTVRWVLVLATAGCAASSPLKETTPAAGGGETPAAGPSGSAQTAAGKEPQTAPLPGSDLTDNTPPALRADFSRGESSWPWTVFGTSRGVREARGGADGLWLRITQGQKPWDAISVRTLHIKIEGDFDLRGHFRDFLGSGDVSAKLIAVDASALTGEAAYVERIQIDGKNLFKFGGEVNGALENWGFVATDAKAGDLRLAREGDTLRAYARTEPRGAWNEIPSIARASTPLPHIIKFGVKLSAGAKQSADVRWTELTIRGKVIRAD